MKQKPLILLAEDDPDDQELIASAFGEVDPSFNLHIVNDGKEVLKFLSEDSHKQLPCLIVLDYNMPELNGAEVLQRLSSNERLANIPKVVLSTSNNNKHIEDCMKKGAHAYRVKPDNFKQLVLIAQEMIALCEKAA